MTYTAKRNCWKLLLALGALAALLCLPGVARANDGTAAWGGPVALIQTTVDGWTGGNNVITVSNGASGTLNVPVGVTELTLKSDSASPVTITDASINFGDRGQSPVTLTLKNVNLHGADNSATAVLHWESQATVTLHVEGTPAEAEIRAGMPGANASSGFGVRGTNNGVLELATGTLRVYGGNGASSDSDSGGNGRPAIRADVTIDAGATLYARGGDGGSTTSSDPSHSGGNGGLGVDGNQVTCNGTVTLVGGNGGSAVAGSGGKGGIGVRVEAAPTAGLFGQGSFTLQGGTGGSSQGGAGGAGGWGLWFDRTYEIEEGTYTITGGAGGSSQSGSGGAGGVGIYCSLNGGYLDHTGGTLTVTGGAGGDVGPGGTPGSGAEAAKSPGNVRNSLPNTYTPTKGADGRVHTPASYSGFTLEFSPRTLTHTPTGITVSGSGIATTSRVVAQPNKQHDASTCRACAELHRRQAAGEVIVLYDISLTHGHSGPVEVFIPFSGSAGTYTVLHCNNGVLEEQSAPYANGGVTTTWRKLSPFAVVRGGNVNVPENVVVDPPKTGAGSAAPVGAVLVACAVGLGLLVRRRRIHHRACRGD